jgi:ankyrin repeat protein
MQTAIASFPDAILPLLENGADPDTRDNNGKTALDLAEASKNLGAIAMPYSIEKRSLTTLFVKRGPS